MTPASREPRELLDEADASLLDLVDHVLNKGVVISAHIVIGLANVDLVYVRLSALLCAADRVLPSRSSRRATQTRTG